MNTLRFIHQRKYLICPVFLIALFHFFCGSSVRVQYDYIEDHNFESYRTFDFMATPNDLIVDDKGIRRIKNAVINEMENKGFEMRFTRPDFLIALQKSVDTRVEIQNWGYTYAPYGNYHGGYEYWGTPSMSMYRYEEGTLVIDIIDPLNMMLIWRGVAQRVLPPRLDSDRINEIENEAVRRVLYYWPPD